MVCPPVIQHIVPNNPPLVGDSGVISAATLAPIPGVPLPCPTLLGAARPVPPPMLVVASPLKSWLVGIAAVALTVECNQPLDDGFTSGKIGVDSPPFED